MSSEYTPGVDEGDPRLCTIRIPAGTTGYRFIVLPLEVQTVILVSGGGLSAGELWIAPGYAEPGRVSGGTVPAATELRNSHDLVSWPKLQTVVPFRKFELFILASPGTDIVLTAILGNADIAGGGSGGAGGAVDATLVAPLATGGAVEFDLASAQGLAAEGGVSALPAIPVLPYTKLSTNASTESTAPVAVGAGANVQIQPAHGSVHAYTARIVTASSVCYILRTTTASPLGIYLRSEDPNWIIRANNSNVNAFNPGGTSIDVATIQYRY